MPGIAGRRAVIKVPGAVVALTGEACLDSGDHQHYQITNTTKRVWDPQSAITVKVGGSPAAEAYTINRLTGTITFAAVNAGRAAVTVDGNYLPLSTAAESTSYSYAIVATNAVDNSFGDDWATRVRTVLDVSATLGRWWIDTYFRDALINASVLVLQFFADGSNAADLLVWVLPKGTAWMSKREGLSDQSVQFEGVLDADNRAISLAP